MTSGEPEGWSRRRFLAGAGLAGVALSAAACGGGGNGAASRAPTTGAPPDTATLSSDLAVAKLAAGLEQMAVDTYDATLTATAEGRLGPVPFAVATYVTTARGHHVDHLAAWNQALQAGGQPTVTAADAGLEPTLDKMLTDVKDVTGAVALAALVEEILADTYLKSIPTLTDKDSIRTAGQILIVDQQHRAILLYMLGQYPVPEPFQVPDKAAS